MNSLPIFNLKMFEKYCSCYIYNQTKMLKLNCNKNPQILDTRHYNRLGIISHLIL